MTSIEILGGLYEAKNAPLAEEAAEALVDGHGYSWRPVADNDANYGSVNIGSDPGLAFVERITNAIDGVIELRASEADVKVAKSLKTPRDAVQKLFGVKDGRSIQLTPEQRTSLSSKIVITILDGSAADLPTLEVRDFGVGIAPMEMPNTILSLARSNKLNKPYLAGAYGQGGSTTFAFSRCTLLAVRGLDDQIGLTLVRFNPLDPAVNKNGRYEYLVDPDGNPPSLPAELLPFERGVLVRHYDYEFKSYCQQMTQLQKSLWSLSHSALFDPVLPFTLVEGRSRYPKVGRRTIVGNFSRLENDRRDNVEYSQSVTVTVRGPKEYGRAVIHYWVISDSSDGSDSYINPSTPMVFTNYGQTHGYEDRRFVVDELQLPFLKKYLIVQVELDDLSPSAKRELMSSTRDRLKRGALYDQLLEDIADALRDDDRLQTLNAERRSKVMQKNSVADQDKIKRRFVELLERYRAGTVVAAAGNGAGSATKKPTGGESSQEALPLPTSERPSFIKIGNKIRPIEIRENRLSLILIESDAPDGYLSANPSARLGVIAEPSQSLEAVRHTDFIGGRARLALKLASGSVGDAGTINAFLLDIDEKAYSDKSPYVVLANVPETQAGANGQSKVDAPHIQEIYEDGWSDLDWTADSVVRVDIAQDKTTIFVNMDNKHLKRLLHSGNYQETGINRMKSGFLIYVAFFAFLQKLATRDGYAGVSSDDLDRYQQSEHDRLAQTIIASIAASERVDALSVMA